MERTIKFRGKRIDNGEWVYGNLVIEDDECYISTGFPGIALDEGYWANSYGYPPSSSDFHITNIYEVISKTVGQFTGLKDKNGVEIYEGDVIAHKLFPDDVEIVKYKDGGFRVGKFLLSTFHCSVIKRVGNIFDNPELIANLE